MHIMKLHLQVTCKMAYIRDQGENLVKEQKEGVFGSITNPNTPKESKEGVWVNSQPQHTQKIQEGGGVWVNSQSQHT
jgi:hypothetical protein